MSSRCFRWGLALLLGVAATLHLDAGNPLTLTVVPAQSFAPGYFRVEVHLEPNSENSALEIVVDSADFYRSSLLQLDGDRAPRVITLIFPSMPVGDYQIHGILLDTGEHTRARVRQIARVVSG